MPKPKRKIVARKIVDLFESFDCDTIYEAETLCKDADLPDAEEEFE